MNIDPHILSLIDETDQLRHTKKDAWQIPREEAQMLHLIALSTGAKFIVEVGTSYGFSGLFWGAAMKRNQGHLHTIDNNPAKYDASKLTFAKAGLNDVITNHLGDAQQILPRLPGDIDIAFIDADKPACQAYFDLIWPKLRVGGSVLTDNVTSHRQQLAGYVQYVRSRPDATSAEITVGNGVEWTVKWR